MDTDNLDPVARGRRVSRRWLLRSTANLTAGLVAAGNIEAIDASAPKAPIEAARVDAVAAPDHDPSTGEIFDRERHHHWDTV